MTLFHVPRDQDNAITDIRIVNSMLTNGHSVSFHSLFVVLNVVSVGCAIRMVACVLKVHSIILLWQ